MPKLLGIVGALVICAGLDLLWQARRELRFWLSGYVKLPLAILRLDAPLRFFLIRDLAQKRQSAIQFLLGMVFTFVLGPVLIAVGVTLMFHMHF